MTRLAVTFALAATFALSTSVMVDAQRGTGGGRGGNGGHGGNGFRSQGRAEMPSTPSTLGDLSSLNRPLGADINGIQTTPPPGFGPQVPSPFAARPGTYTRIHRELQSFGTPLGYGFDAAGYGPFYESTYDKMYRRAQPEITTGTLFLDVTPATASVFVDTAYVGSVGDLQARGLTVSAARHYVDLEAPGYDRRTIEIAITAGEPLRYRYDMTPTQRAAAVVLPPRPPETIYAIPGCYGGNRPPVAANLPKGCDIAKVRVLRPQPRAN